MYFCINWIFKKIFCEKKFKKIDDGFRIYIRRLKIAFGIDDETFVPFLSRISIRYFSSMGRINLPQVVFYRNETYRIYRIVDSFSIPRIWRQNLFDNVMEGFHYLFAFDFGVIGKSSMVVWLSDQRAHSFSTNGFYDCISFDINFLEQEGQKNESLYTE